MEINNLLVNSSFEDGEVHDRGFGFWFPSSDHYPYCDGDGYESPCYLGLGLGSGDHASVYQDVSPPYQVTIGSRFAGTARLRCPKGQAAACSASMTYWGMGKSDLEGFGFPAVAVPADGRWYECRLDAEHGAETGMKGEHTSLRFEIYSHRGGDRQSLHIDALSFGTYKSGIPSPSGTSPCALAD